MELTPREKDKLLIFTASLLAERRMARGLKTAPQKQGMGETVPEKSRKWKVECDRQNSCICRETAVGMGKNSS